MAILKDLIVHGSSRFLNKIYANELEVSAFEAESAIIKKLTAKDATLENATVIGLLDVQGQLHTNTWTNSNIATIDGCFYITPTLSSNSGTISFSSTSVASLTGTYAAVTSLYIGDSSSGSTVQWTSGSNVLLTGEVEVNGQWLPLGTLLGTLSANATTSSIGLTGLTDNRHNTSSIITDIRNAVSNASLNYRNLKISLYQRKDGTDSKPLGIYMTAMGTNGKTFIDIYGGVNATTTAGSSGGFADPNLRIGNLSGLGAVEGTTPTGWGIYTTNGYFKGVIVSSAGKIGNFTINSALYSNNHSAWNSNVSGIYINNDGISGGAGGKWWLWNDGSAKIGEMTLSAAGVLTVPAANVSGELTAATINGSKITANTITADQIAAGAIKTDELDANAVTSAKIKAGEVKATNIASSAVTADKLDATTINASNKLTVGALTTATQNDILNSNIQIGGRNLVLNSNNELSSKNAITTYSFSDYGISNIKGKKITISADIKSDTANTGLDVYIRASATSSAENDYTIINNIGTSYSHFSVVVTVYSNDHIPNQLAFRTTQINSAATFNIKNVKVELGNKATDWSPAPEDLDVHKYITDIDSNKGITVKPADASGNDYLQMNSSAINFYRNNVETLKIEDSAIRVGKLGNNLRNVYITDSAVQIRNNTSVLAEYGSSIKLYQPTTTTVAVEISSTGATFTGNVKATSLSTGTKTASTTGKGTYIDGNGNIYVGNGSTNNFTVTDTGTITATGANLLTATIGNATNKITIGTGTSGHSSIRYGMTTFADPNNNGFYIGTDGIALGKGAFKVTAAGALTATSGSISGGIVTSGIDASNITVGTLGADRIGAGSIAIGKLDTSTQTKISNVVKQSIETIIGTQTSNTYSWTGTSSTLTASDLIDGLTINYFLPYSVGGSQVSATYKRLSDNANVNTSGAVLNLTFSDGTSTGNLPIWYQGVGRLTSHYGYGSIIKMTYYENIRMANAYEATGWWVDAQYNSDTYDNRIIYFTGKTGTKGIWAGSLFMEDASGAYQGICCASDGTITNASSGNGARTTATTKIANANGFKVGSTIYYTNTSYNANTNISGYAVIYSNMGNVFDSRYCMNTTLTAGSLTTYKPWYLVGSINSSDGLFYLDSTWWTQTPNTTGKVYILGGGVYDSTTSNCRITLYEDNVWYIYNGSALVPYEKYASDQAAKTATTYITDIDSNKGITIKPSNSSGNDYLQINSSAITTYKNNTDVMSLGNNSFRMGTASGKHTTVDSNGLHVWIGSESTAANEVGLFGSTARIGAPASSRFLLNADSLQAYNSSNVKYFEVSASGLSFGGNAVAKASDIPTTVSQLTDSGNYLTTTVAANTYATQTAANNAAQTASKYITAIDQNGIKVHAENNPDNNYTSITADGMSVYQDIDGTAIEVASFGSDGAKIGKEASNSFTVFDRGIIGSNSQGADIFILDSEGNTSGTVPVQTYYNKIQYYYSKSGTSNSHCTIIIPDNVSSGSAKLNYERGYSYWSQASGKVIQVSSSVSQNFTIGTALDHTTTFNTYAHIHFVYDGNRTIEMTIYSDGWGSNVTSYDFSPNFLTYPVFIKMPALTFGTRGDSEIGGFSICFGENNIGSGYGTAAIGVGNIASGDYQTAIGKYNIADQTSLFIIGNGNQSTRSNALTVSTEGNLNIAGTANIGGNTSITGSLSATGSITQNGTAVSLNGHTHSSTIVYEDETVSISYAAGTIGSRGTQVNCGTTAKSGYTYIGASVLSHTNTSSFSVNLIRNNGTENLHLMVYRATGNAVSNASVIIRKVWIKNGFVSAV